MKHHHLLPLLLLLLLPSCRTLPTVQVVPRIQHDTTYVTTHHYDSIYVENQLIQERRSDTLYVDRVRTELRYRLLHDTCYVSRIDTVPVIHTVTVPRQPNRFRTWLDRLSHLYTLASLPGLLILLLCLIKGFRR